jgi:hypothetical protein
MQLTSARRVNTRRFMRGNVADEMLSCEVGAANAFDGPSLDGWVCPSWPRLGFGDGWKTEDECKFYCCADPACVGYLYNSTLPDSCGNHACTPTCRVGESLDGCYKSSTPIPSWHGMSRTKVPAAVPMPPSGGPQDKAFNDSEWRTVTLPHDYLIEHNPTADGDYSHGYRPKDVAWYRRPFSLDADSYANKAVWVEFDGVFRASDVWLNGKFLGHHSSG